MRHWDIGLLDNIELLSLRRLLEINEMHFFMKLGELSNGESIFYL